MLLPTDARYQAKRAVSTRPWKIMPHFHPLPLPRPHCGPLFERRSSPLHSFFYSLEQQQRARQQSRYPSSPSCKAGISWISACGKNSAYRCHGVDIDRTVSGIADPVVVYLARFHEGRQAYNTHYCNDFLAGITELDLQRPVNFFFFLVVVEIVVGLYQPAA